MRFDQLGLLQILPQCAVLKIALVANDYIAERDQQLSFPREI